MQDLPFLDYPIYTYRRESDGHNQANPNKRKIGDEFSVEESQPKRFKASTDDVSSKEEKKSSFVKSSYQEMKNEEDQWMRDSIKNPFSPFVASKSGETEKKWIEIRNGENTTTFNIDFLVKDLFLKKSKIREAERKGKLSIDWLKRNEEKAKIARVYYEELSKKLHPSSFLYSYSEVMEKIRAIITKKIVQEAYQPIATQEGKDFYIRFDRTQRKIVLIELDQAFYQGSNAIMRIASSSPYLSVVFKQANLDLTAIEKVRNEFNLLSYIHQVGKVWGIQAKPYEFIHIQARKDPNAPFSSTVGYLSPQYKYNYSQFMNPHRKFQELLMDFHQFLAALAGLEHNGIVHGDITAKNFLVKIEEDGTRLIHLIDFHSAMMIHDLSIEPHVQLDRKSLFAIHQKNDVFALGRLLYFILTGQNYAPGLTPNQINRTDVPKEIKDLIRGILGSPDIKQPTASEAFKRYARFLADTYPAIYAKINSKIEAEYPGSHYLLDQPQTVLSKKQEATIFELENDARFYLLALKVHHSFISDVNTSVVSFASYVTIQDEHNTFFLHVNHLVKVLSLTEKKIKSIHEQGKFSINWLKKNIEKAKRTLVYYEEISTQIPPSIFLCSPLEVRQKIRSILTNKPLEEAYQLIATQDKKDFYIRFNQEKQTVVLSKLELPFASGGFGSVRIFSSSHSAPSVFKQASDRSRAEEDVEREYHTLCYLHEQGQAWGIQAKPYELIHIQARKDDNDSFSSQTGHLGPKYEMDYSKFADPKRSYFDLVIDFHQLLAALAKLEKAGVLHGDIKPENILIRTDADGTRLVHLADFGTAVMIHDEKDKFLATMTHRAHTKRYTYKEELSASKQALEMGDCETVVKIEHKRDVFSMGSTLYFMLTKKRPYHLLNDYPDLQRKFRKIYRADVPTEIKKLITSMINPDPTKRPTAKKAFETYETFLFQNYRPIYEKIRSKVQAEYPGSYRS